MQAAVFLDLDDVAKAAVGARVGGVDLIGFALGVVGQHDVGGAVAARLRVFGAVHRRGAQGISGQTGVDHHVGLAVKAVFGGQRTGAMHQRQPSDGAVFVKAGDVKRAVGHQRRSECLVAGHAAVRDIFVLIVKAVVVAAVDHQLAVFRNAGFGAFMAETTQSGVFDRHGVGVARVNLDDPAPAVRLLRLKVDVPVVVELAPGVPTPRHAVALQFRGLGVFRDVWVALGVQLVGPEVAVEVFLGHQVGAPGCHAACTVVDGAHHGHAFWVGIGLHTRMTCGGAVEGHLGVKRCDAAVVFAVAHQFPFAGIVAGNLDDSATVRGHFDVDQLGRHACEIDVVLTAKAGEHDLFVGVFVVDAQQAAVGVAVQRSKAHVVVVIAELLQLGGGGLVHHVEFGCICGDRIAPAQQHVGVVTFGDVVGGIVAPGQFVEHVT